VRNSPVQQFAINQDEVFQRQFIGKLRRPGKGYFHFSQRSRWSAWNGPRRYNELREEMKLVLISAIENLPRPELRHCRPLQLAETMIALIKIVRFI